MSSYTLLRSPMRRQFISRCAYLAGAPLLASCALIDVSETIKTRRFSVRRNFPYCPIDRVSFVKSVVSLSIGISEFRDSAAWIGTPAHGIGANMMHELMRPKGGACIDITGKFGRCDALADTTIRMEPGTPEAESARWMLKLTTEPLFAFRINDAPSLVKPGPDGRWLYFGNGELMTRQRVLDRVRDSVARARSVFDVEGEVLLIVYVSSHGIIGADGKANLIPWDGDATDQRTWLGFDKLLAPVFDFVDGKANPGQARQALVFIDCCQKIVATPRELAGLADSLPNPPPGVALVTSSSPGQWAWHYASKLLVVGEVNASKRGLLGIPMPADEKSGQIDQSLKGFMSVFPLATRCAMSIAAQAFDEQYGTDPQVTHAEVTIEDWVSSTKNLVAEFLENDPVRQLIRRRQDGQVDERQDVQVKVGAPFGAPVLIVKRKT